MEVNRLVPLGELSVHGGKIVPVSITYSWRPVPAAPFSIGFALAAEDATRSKISGYPTIDAKVCLQTQCVFWRSLQDKVTNFYHEVGLYPEPYRSALNLVARPPTDPTHPNQLLASHSCVKVHSFACFLWIDVCRLERVDLRTRTNIMWHLKQTKQWELCTGCWIPCPCQETNLLNSEMRFCCTPLSLHRSRTTGCRTGQMLKLCGCMLQAKVSLEITLVPTWQRSKTLISIVVVTDEW